MTRNELGLNILLQQSEFKRCFENKINGSLRKFFVCPQNLWYFRNILRSETHFYTMSIFNHKTFL